MKWDDNLEIVYSEEKDQTEDTCFWNEDDNEPYGTGFYHRFCFSGCLPENDPSGPFDTEKQAYENAKYMYEDDNY
jgi:hypothetical protein